MKLDEFMYKNIFNPYWFYDDEINNLNINNLMVPYNKCKDGDTGDYKINPCQQDENELNYLKS